MSTLQVFTGPKDVQSYMLPLSSVPSFARDAVIFQRSSRECIVYSAIAKGVVTMPYPLTSVRRQKVAPLQLIKYFNDCGRYIACFCGLADENDGPTPSVRIIPGGHLDMWYAICHYSENRYGHGSKCGFFLNITSIYSFGALVSNFRNLPAGPGTYEHQKLDHHDYTAVATIELQTIYRALPPNIRAHVAPVFVEYGGEFSMHNHGMRMLNSNFKDRVSLGVTEGAERCLIQPVSSLFCSSNPQGQNRRGIFISLSFSIADSA
ncbi:hypothetical protein BT96DRAFT_1008483 [Gymnopus androsaceus JB14]|uniref:Uncharacterized protein n=1 Tax=Gymnopus androsaceus JB14 TaxID=1447944 RepID=A0A6A4GF11_9AGAR|nr:hypothetical protein BT96DRAFT_1008483 [Gymnopus androsaceus JB14]